MKTRVTSVENGRKYQVGGGGEVAMPDGASIFETTGAWEDFATPSRDLRLLIAIDVVRAFPDRVARRPERYAMPKDRAPPTSRPNWRACSRRSLRRASFPIRAPTARNGRSRSRTCSTARRRSRWRTTSNDCVELQMGRGGGQRRGLDLQAACACLTAPEDERIPRLARLQRRRRPRGLILLPGDRATGARRRRPSSTSRNAADDASRAK